MHVRAHPRVGGENPGSDAHPRSGRGSSPRGRGKLDGGGASRPVMGLIPAWAGKTRRVRPTDARRTAHPRVGGENWRSCVGWRRKHGSSPRGRGKLGFCSNVEQVQGLIPAWAGKTFARGTSIRHPRAHPRVGGENLGRREMFRFLVGSSPRGRGKRYPRSRSGSARRLIPAWAGKTWRRGLKGHSDEAHPRVGGENAAYVGDVPNDTGSSPRGRGKRR